MKLHLGCGRRPKTGWVNLDARSGPGVDLVHDLDQCASQRLPLDDDSVTEVLAEHLLEHLHNPLPLLAELHRVCQPGALALFRVPYGHSDTAWADPTHVRPYFLDSWGFFAQPAYRWADYGYRGDWQPEEVELFCREGLRTVPPERLIDAIHRQRNLVLEMSARLRCIKPARDPRKSLPGEVALRLAFSDSAPEPRESV